MTIAISEPKKLEWRKLKRNGLFPLSTEKNDNNTRIELKLF